MTAQFPAPRSHGVSSTLAKIFLCHKSVWNSAVCFYKYTQDRDFSLPNFAILILFHPFPEPVLLQQNILLPTLKQAQVYVPDFEFLKLNIVTMIVWLLWVY